MQRFLTLLGLTGLTVSQPLLSALGEQPTLFVFNGVSGFGLVIFAAVVAFAPPLVLWGVESIVARFRPSFGRPLHLAFVAALVALAASQLLRSTFGLDQALVVAGLALAAGGAAAWAFSGSERARQFLAYLAPLPVLAVALFLFASETTPLLSLETGPSAATSGADVSPVVVLVLDELPTESVLDAEGGLDRERFPNLARFAEDANWYRNYTTTASHTVFAVPSILSGQAPIDAEPLYTSHPDNLFSLLEPTHELSVFESFTKLCSLSDCEGTGEQRTRWSALARTTLDVLRTRVDPFADTGESTMADFEEEIVTPAKEKSVEGSGVARGNPNREGVSGAVPTVPRIDPCDRCSHPALHAPGPSAPALALLPRRDLRTDARGARVELSLLCHQRPGGLGRDAERAATPVAGAVHRRAGRPDARPAPPHGPLRRERDRDRQRPRLLVRVRDDGAQRRGDDPRLARLHAVPREAPRPDQGRDR